MSTAPVLSSHDQDEIDLQQLFAILWQGRVKIILTTVIFAVLSVLYALSLPDRYSATTILSSSQSGSGGGLSSQYGSLAALAGINLASGSSNRLEQAVEVLGSWPFIEKFVQKHDLVAPIMAVKEWDKSANQLIYDSDLYDVNTHTWIEKEPNVSPIPSSYKVYQRFSKMLKVDLNSKTGFLTLELEYFSPEIAHQWVNWLVQDINAHFQTVDINEAKNNIDYLNRKIEETPITEMKSVFYNLIEAQTKSLMLAEVSEQYLVKEIIPPMIPELKNSPNRAFICAIGLLIGIVLGCLWAVMVLIKLGD